MNKHKVKNNLIIKGASENKRPCDCFADDFSSNLTILTVTISLFGVLLCPLDLIVISLLYTLVSTSWSMSNYFSVIMLFKLKDAYRTLVLDEAVIKSMNVSLFK